MFSLVLKTSDLSVASAAGPAGIPMNGARLGIVDLATELDGFAQK
jgi:hypothetical protein